MKKVTKTLFLLLCVVTVLSLSACDGKQDTESKNKKDTSAVTDTYSGNKNTGGKIIQPEDGKITFGKDSDESNNSAKSTGDNSSENSKPSVNNNISSGGNQEETTSVTEPEEKDNEGEFVIPSEEIQLPVVPLK